MGPSARRRLGAILLVFVLLAVGLVPSAAASSAEAPREASAAGMSAGTTCRWVYYRVVRGDNLTRIAWRYGVTVGQLQGWNGIWNPDRIYVGSVLKIKKCTWAPDPKPQPPVCVACPPPPQPPPPPPANCWHVDYFNDANLGGPVVASTCTQTIAFNWGWNAPAPGVNADHFSARFTNTLNLAKGTWRITVRSDDGIKVFIDDVPVIDDWRIQAPTTDWRDVLIQTSGNHNFRVEYFENDQHAEVYVWCQKIK